MKCEIPECYAQTENFLCDDHRQMAQDRKNYQVTVCRNCDMFVKIEKKESKKPNEILYIDKCPYCNFFNKMEKR